MLWLATLIATSLIVLHAPDGQVIYLNPEQVTNLRKPRGVNEGHFIKGTNCLVFTTDGKYFATVEPCTEVDRLIKGSTGKSTSFPPLIPKPNT